MKILLTLATLALLSTGASAGTVPSTFDANCNVNWVGGGCDAKLQFSTAAGTTDVDPSQKPEPEPEPEPPTEPTPVE